MSASLPQKSSLCVMLPTPLMESKLQLTGQNQAPTIYIKRDDLTGRAGGGNKLRKLEYLLRQALDSKATVVLTCGGVQSNHCRQTALAAAAVGLKCVLVQTKNVPQRDSVYFSSGNVVLNKLAGTTIHTYPAGTDRQAKMELWAEQLRQAGETPYIIPLGGSNALGSQGYVDCAKEILSQTQQRVTHVVVASSSLGTQAGLLSGFLLQNREDIRVIGVDIEGVDVQATQQALRELVASSVQLNTGKAIHPSSINTPVVFQGYQGAGYGVETQVGLNAIQLCARTDGVLLDPVYSGKAMSALLAGSKGMGIDESSVVVFIHTGGAHSLYAYNTALTAKL